MVRRMIRSGVVRDGNTIEVDSSLPLESGQRVRAYVFALEEKTPSDSPDSIIWIKRTPNDVLEEAGDVLGIVLRESEREQTIRLMEKYFASDEHGFTLVSAPPPKGGDINGSNDATLVNEPALAEDRNRLEEDETWQHLISILESINTKRT